MAQPDKGRGHRTAVLAAAVALLLAGQRAAAVGAEKLVDISTLDLQALLDLPVKSVTLHEERSSEAAASVFALSGEDIRRQGFRTLQEVLRSVPGFFAYRDDLYPLVGVRGLGLPVDYTTRILVLVDGHPLNNALALGQSFFGRDLPVPLASVQRIEVIKGPAGSIYGPTAFLGVVNVITSAGAEADSSVWSEVAGAQGRALPGALGAQLTRSAGDLRFFVAGEGFRTSGNTYTFPELQGASDRPAPAGGRVAGMASSDALTGYGRISWRDLTAVGACNQMTRGTPTAPFSSNLLDPGNRIENRTCYAQVGLEHALANGFTISTRAAYDDSLYRDTFRYDPPPASYGNYHDLGRDQWFSGDVHLTWEPSARTLLVGGATAARHHTLQRSDADGLPTVRDDPVNGVGVGDIARSWNQLNTYALAEQAIGERLRVHAGLTFFVDELFGNRLTPKAALVWTPTRAGVDVIKAIYSEGFRAPTASEAFFEDGTDFLPNPGLKPETVRSLELVAEHRLGGATMLTLSLFQNDYRQLIRYVTVAPDPQDPSDLRERAENVGALRLRGGELAVNASWGDDLRAWGGVSAQQSDQAGLANFPAVTGNLAVSTRALWRPLTLSLRGAFGATRTKFVAGEAPGFGGEIGPFFVMGATALLDVPGVRGLSLELSVANLLGAYAPSPLTIDSAPITELAEPPRTFRLAARWSFR